MNYKNIIINVIKYNNGWRNKKITFFNLNSLKNIKKIIKIIKKK